MNIASGLVFRGARHLPPNSVRAVIAIGLFVVAAIAAASIAGLLPPGSEEILTAAPFRW